MYRYKVLIKDNEMDEIIKKLRNSSDSSILVSRTNLWGMINRIDYLNSEIQKLLDRYAEW